ncbi:hypothetical protein [Ekhidna sp.]|uniref:hypothetical protein n=1 Tax=Ekhidna sp. TaxID=2608089 RepID=UPI003B50CDBA
MKISLPIQVLFVLSAFLLLVSCSNDDSPIEVTSDFTINSTDNFQIESSHENGWIKEATMYSDLTGLKISEFEYHENGYIKHCKSYSHGGLSTDNHYLNMEVFRDENNLPTQSIYYNPDGSVQAEITYEEGLIKEKKIYKNDQSTICSYVDGRIQVVVSDLEAGQVEMTYNYIDNVKNIKVIKQGDVEFESEISLLSDGGEGISTIDNHARSNRFVKENSSINILNSTFTTSSDWEGFFEPEKIMPIPLIYSESNFFGLLNGYFSHEFDAFRMMVEEFPVFEDDYILSKFNIQSEEVSFNPSIASSEEVKMEMSANLVDFELKYGDEFLRKKIIGKYGFTIAVLRNLPSDPVLRSEIKNLAYKKVGSILGSEDLTTDEDILLSKVFFEYKFFSPVLGINGKVLTSNTDYEIGIDLINNNQEYTIQKIYKAYDLL